MYMHDFKETSNPYVGNSRVREEEMAKRAIEEKARREEELRKQEEEKRLAYEEQQRQAEEERIRREQEEQEKLAELQHQVCLSVGSDCASHTSCIQAEGVVFDFISENVFNKSQEWCKAEFILSEMHLRMSWSPFLACDFPGPPHHLISSGVGRKQKVF